MDTGSTSAAKVTDTCINWRCPVGKTTAPQPLSAVQSAVKATLLVGALPVRRREGHVTPTEDGLAELASSVVGARLVAVSAMPTRKC
jgi:hypothetical protein